ncbi:hypothetical protein RJ639_047583 [Escallonia herrerae]|uniref:Uncharacterized protein n=1 Tax=Escallonia herrerae TaxID=1293975 RepID=A0AA88W7C3_9ASTE|nr:hypothetical protein RJ639_047583 [Escallonia herrerae]
MLARKSEHRAGGLKGMVVAMVVGGSGVLAGIFQLKSDSRWPLNFAARSQTKKDDMLTYKLERIPFLEEQVRKIRDGGSS